MRYSNQGRLLQQVRFLRRQFLQDGGLPFSNVLSEGIVLQAVAAIDVYWMDTSRETMPVLSRHLDRFSRPAWEESC